MIAEPKEIPADRFGEFVEHRISCLAQGYAGWFKRKQNSCKPVIVNGVEYGSSFDASEALRVSDQSIREAARNPKRRTFRRSDGTVLQLSVTWNKKHLKDGAR